MSKWIDIEDTFPPDNQEILLCSYVGAFYIGFVKNGETFDEDGLKHTDFIQWLHIPDWQE
jgi:predicted GNAT family N-acyltransferase